MRPYQAALIAILFAATTAQAHVRVLPAEADVSARQTYTVRVPTEGTVATTSVELEVPVGVSVISADGQSEMKTVGGRTVSITWKVAIPPGESAELSFVAMNPAQGEEIVWKAHQHYADGTSSHWIDLPKTRSPAPITKLRPAPGQ